jgi:hypothetical protein
MTMTIETSNFPNVQNDHFDHDYNTILLSNGHGQVVKINRYFNNFNKFPKFNNKKSGIWIDQFDYENFGIFGMVMVKIGLSILTIETQFWPNGQKIVVIEPPPPQFTYDSSTSNLQS